MASQLARGFLAEQDLERFVREEHGGNRAAAARAKAASGEACMRNAPKAALKYFRDALDLATTEAARAAVHRLCAAACLEIGHFNRCVGHATRALAVDANDLESLRHRLTAHEALGAWRRERDLDSATRSRARGGEGGDQPVELHAPSESHKSVDGARRAPPVWKSTSRARRVDGVEDDTTIQHERAVKFDFHTRPCRAGHATVWRGPVDERSLSGVLRALFNSAIVAAAPRETFFTKQVVVKGPCRLRHLAFCAGARATADLGLEDCVVACPGGVGVDASAALSLKRCLVEHCADGVVARGALDVRGTTVRHCANVGLDASESDGPARVEEVTVAACGAAVRGAVEFAGSGNDVEGV